MKLSTAFVFLLCTVITAQEAVAQTRGPRYNPPGGGGSSGGAGTVNTGGGGGGASFSPAVAGTGGSGGSGIVIIKYTI